jgi:hypothetical protein
MTGSQKEYNGKKTYYWYLVCGDAADAGKCKYCSVSLLKFERSFFCCLINPEFFSVYHPTKEVNDEAKQKLEEASGELGKVKRMIEKLTTTFLEEENPPRALVQKLKELESKEVKLQSTIRLEEAKMQDLSGGGFQIEELTDWQTQLKKPEFREKTKSFIRTIIKELVVNTSKKTFTARFKNGMEWVDRPIDYYHPKTVEEHEKMRKEKNPHYIEWTKYMNDPERIRRDSGKRYPKGYNPATKTWNTDKERMEWERKKAQSKT